MIPALLHLAARAALDNAADLGLPDAAVPPTTGAPVQPEVIPGQ